MIRKRNLYTVMGVALSFVVTFGGWMLTSELLDKMENDLFSMPGSIHVNAPIVSPTDAGKNTDDGDEGIAQTWPVLSKPEMFKVLLNWEADGYERPHEPVEGQLNMEQAIDAAKAGLSYFYEQGIIPAELLEYDKTNAYLCENQPRGQETYTRGQEDHTLDPYYSYWTVTFSGENKSVAFTINAMTGQIWKAAIPGVSTDEIGAEKILDAFVAYLDLGNGGSYMTDGTTASKSFADGILYVTAVVRTSTTSVSTDKDTEITRFFRMYLSTQSPTIE